MQNLGVCNFVSRTSFEGIFARVHTKKNSLTREIVFLSLRADFIMAKKRKSRKCAISEF